MLQKFNLKKPVTVEMNVSDYVTADVLSQPNKEGNLHPVTFFFNKMSSEKCNYEIYNKKLLIIVKVFEEWCSETHDTADPVTVLINHKNLEYFIIICKLNCCQACWNEFLSEFNFKIVYWPEVINHITDALICCASNYPHNEKNLWNAYQY